MFSELLGLLAGFAISTISFLGYGGVFVLMILESTLFPIPSELVMPFAGFLAFQGKMNFWVVVLLGGLGATVGSLLSYYLGYYGGKPFIRKFGKYFLVNEHDMEWTEKWFKKHGEKTIFISRFVPVVRHLISVPAGMAQMNIKKFTAYTFAGALLWSLLLTYAGYYLGSRWEEVHHITRNFSFAIVGIIVVVGIWYIVRHLKRKK